MQSPRKLARSAATALALAVLVIAPVGAPLLDDSARRPAATTRGGSVAPAAPNRTPSRSPDGRVRSPAFHAHSGAQGVRGLSERRLRAFEAATLGPEHARQHALIRDQLPARTRASASRTGAAAATSDGSASQTSAVGAAATDDPAEVGRWSAPFSIPVMAIHGAVLPTGKVMWFSYPKNPSPRHGGEGTSAPNTAQAWLWDPATGANKRVDPPLWRDPKDGQLKPANIWCAGQAFTADGRLVVAGGNLDYGYDGSDFKGLNKVYTFNPFNETWTEQPDMRRGRWYPSQVLLPDGRMPILSGLDETGQRPGNFNSDVEIFTPSSDMNGRGTVSHVGSRGGAGQPPNGGLYPHLFSMPSGRTLVAGPYPSDSWFMNTPGTSSFSWQDAPGTARDRLWGTGVLMPGGPGGSTRVMQLGGSAPPTVDSSTTDIAVNTTETFDEANQGLGWRAAPSMNVGRAHHNTVLLPDGSMASVGGGVGIRNGDQWAADPEQKQIELWDPATGNWRLGPAQAESRAYHSIGMLLPDGRVISGGDDVNGGTDRDTAEIYEPPYLFRGPRPTISGAPASVAVGTDFDVDTPDGNVTKANLVAPAAVTHAVDMNQRAIPLTVNQRTNGVRLSAPANGEIAPPGYYMLFLLNDRGVPSTAKWVKLTGAPPATSEDKAAGRPTSASSVERTGLEAGKAVDGSSSTRWSSTFTDNQWWQVDLGSVRKVSKVELNWEHAYASRYRILTSLDGTSFSEAADVTIGSSGTKASTFSARDARYVRIQGVTRATPYGISFWDARVFGPVDDGQPPPPPPPPPDPDLARGKSTSASSVEKAGLEPSKAVDGSSTTRWSSAFTDNQWWQVDLGAEKRIDEVELNWEDAYASRYRVLTSTDGASFSQAADVSIASPGLKATSFPARDARYVRIEGVTRATPYGISFWDARVFAAPDAPAPPPQPPSTYPEGVKGTPGLSGYWRFGEASGTTAAPAAGSMSGAYGTGVTLGQPGLIAGDSDRAAAFRGASGAQVRFADAFDFSGNAPFSVEAWVKPSTVDATGRRIFSKEWANSAGGQGWYLLSTSSRLQFSRVVGGVYQNVNASPLTVGGRYHLVVTYDGSTTRLYVNGSQVAAAPSGRALVDGPAVFTIGSKTGGGGHWAGTIDEPAVYTGALSPAQIEAHHRAGG